MFFKINYMGLVKMSLLSHIINIWSGKFEWQKSINCFFISPRDWQNLLCLSFKLKGIKALIQWNKTLHLPRAHRSTPCPWRVQLQNEPHTEQLTFLKAWLISLFVVGMSNSTLPVPADRQVSWHLPVPIFRAPQKEWMIKGGSRHSQATLF